MPATLSPPVHRENYQEVTSRKEDKEEVPLHQLADGLVVTREGPVDVQGDRHEH